MNSLNFANFLFERISETITQSNYIEEVCIDYKMNGNFGNEYIRVDYTVTPNQDFYNLTKTAQEGLFNSKPHYIFTISTHAEFNKMGEKSKLLRIMEFKRIYESVVCYVDLQLEHALSAKTIVKIKEIDFWPEANYAEKYLDSALYLAYINGMGSSFEHDVQQWQRLQKLSDDSRTIYTKEKSCFSITDKEINDLFNVRLDDIRFIILNHEIPIKVKGYKTIKEIYIHTIEFVKALKADLKNEYSWRDTSIYKPLINYLYDSFLLLERTKIIEKQKSDFLAGFIIQKGDILQLKDGRNVIADSVQIDSTYAVVIEYLNLKVNLDVGERKRKIAITNISYVLSQVDFLNYKDYTPSRHISLLNKWMLKRKVKVAPMPFKPDLTV